MSRLHGEVLADRVMAGPAEYVPRFTTMLPTVLVVPAGQTVTLPADSTFDAIEVAGILRFERSAYDTTLRVTHLLILPEGYLDCSTDADPVLRKVEIIIRDVPINTNIDPWQWGNSIVNFGRQDRVGRPKRAWTELTADAAVGATSISVADASGWQVGDELLLPDMAQVSPSRFESPRPTITSITGTSIQLSSPLSFPRASVRDPENTLVLRPRVANLTRNIVIRSENPAGARGHTGNVGHGASWNIQHNQYVGLGRTTFNNLDSTSDAHIGTNQIGRYADHLHHGGSPHGHNPDGSPVQRQHIGNAFVGDFRSKFALAVHGTHDALIQENVCTDFQGAGFVTEDGYEVRDAFRRNVAAYTKGNGREADVNGPIAPGGEGSGFWFRALQIEIVENEAWNNHVGINLFSQNIVGQGTAVPGVKGGPDDTVYDLETAVPIEMRGNVMIGNATNGLETWSMSRFPNDGLVAVHNGQGQVKASVSQNNSTWLRNLTAIATPGSNAVGVHSDAAYIASLEIEGGSIRGNAMGIAESGGGQLVVLRDVVMQNQTNVHFVQVPRATRIERVRFLPLGSNPKRYVVLGSGDVWNGTGDPPYWAGPHWMNPKGSQQVVIDWNGTGQDFLLFQNQQKASTAAWPGRQSLWMVPEEGLTMGQAWEKYGLAYGGGAIDDAVAVNLEGLVNAVARPGLNVMLGPPRAILTWPNMLGPVVTWGPGNFHLSFTITGDLTNANEVVVASIDGQPTFRAFVNVNDPNIRHVVNFNEPAAAAGTHAVRTWREDKAGVVIAGSLMTFQYFIGKPADPPPPPPISPCVLSPLVPVLTVTAAGHTVTWTGTLTVSDERGCSVTVTR